MFSFAEMKMRELCFFLQNENKERTKEGQGRLSAIHSDYRRYLGVNISIPNQPTTPLQPINQNEIQKRIDLKLKTSIPWT